MSKIQSILAAGARVKVVAAKGGLVRALSARGLHHCGDLRPIDPSPVCRFCGEDCDGLH
ncbi:MAG: hypothetical protein U0326_09470 [Polyangiales bacterium]